MNTILSNVPVNSPVSSLNTDTRCKGRPILVLWESGNSPEDEFGTQIMSQGTTPNAYRYTGQQSDADSGLLYLRARYYEPSTGRFISQDKYKGDTKDPASLNLYVYCKNNPLKYTDPSGYDGLTPEQVKLFRARTLKAIGTATSMYGIYISGTGGTISLSGVGATVGVPTAIVGFIVTASGAIIVVWGTLEEQACYSKTSCDKGSGNSGGSEDAQFKSLSKGDIQKLKDSGLDVHKIKMEYIGRNNISRYDLFKNKVVIL